MQTRSIAALSAILLLAGCGELHTLEVRDPNGPYTMLGANIRDVTHAVGTPAHYTKFTDTRGPEFDTLEVEWDFSNSDSAFSVSVPFLASVQIGGSGRCGLTATVTRMGGIITRIGYQAHIDGLEADASACGPLLSDWVAHRSKTVLPPTFDAFTLSDDASRKR